MNKFYRCAAMFMLVMIFSLAGSGCTKADLTKGKTPDQIIKAAIKKSREIKNYRFISYIHGTKESSVRGMVSTSLPAAELYQFFVDKNPESVFSIYIRGSAIFDKTSQNPWKPAQENITERGYLEMYMNQVNSANPAAVLPDIYAQKLSIKRLPDETIDGVPVAVIEMVTNFSKLASHQGKNQPEINKADNVTVTIWIGKNDLFVYRYLVKGKMHNYELPVSVTTTVFDFNKTDISAPPELEKFQTSL